MASLYRTEQISIGAFIKQDLPTYQISSRSGKVFSSYHPEMEGDLGFELKPTNKWPTCIRLSQISNLTFLSPGPIHTPNLKSIGPGVLKLSTGNEMAEEIITIIVTVEEFAQPLKVVSSTWGSFEGPKF